MRARIAVFAAVLFLPGSVASPQEIRVSTLNGLVLTDQTPATPIDGVLVTASDVEQGISRQTQSDRQGRFSFAKVPDGRYRISAARAGYVPAVYGVVGAFGDPVPVVLRAGSDPRPTLTMSTGGVVQVTVTETNGSPVAPARVGLIVVPPEHDGQSLLPDHDASAQLRRAVDDQGRTRFATVPGGRYLVYAVRRDPRTGADRVMFAPSALGAAEADLLRITDREERIVNIIFRDARNPSIRGAVTSAGRPVPGAQVLLETKGVMPAARGATAGADGSFVIRDVPAGRYGILARSSRPRIVQGRPTADVSLQWAELSVEVHAADVDAGTVELTPAPVVFGRLRGPQDLLNALVSVTLTPVSPTAFRPTVSMAASATGIPTQLVVPGQYVVSIQPASGRAPMVVDSIAVAGRPQKDGLVTVETGRASIELDIGLVSAAPSVHGFVTDENGDPVSGLTVVVFPESPQERAAGNPRVRSARTATDGSYVVGSLPSGSYALAIVREAWASAVAMDPAVFDQLGGGAVRIAIAPGTTIVQDLRVKLGGN